MTPEVVIGGAEAEVVVNVEVAAGAALVDSVQAAGYCLMSGWMCSHAVSLRSKQDEASGDDQETTPSCE